MRILSLVSLLVVLAIVGVLAARQMKDGGMPSIVPLSTSALPNAPKGTVKQQEAQIKQKVNDDLKKAVEDAQAERDRAIEQVK